MLATPRWFPPVLLLVPLLALTAAGCGGDDDDDGPSPGRDSGTSGQDGAGSGGRAGNGGRAGTGTVGIAGNGASGSGESDAGSAIDGGGGASGSGGGLDSGTAGDAGQDAGTSDSGSPTGCNAEPHEHEHDSEPAMHVTSPLPASEYNSSPPSSGRHCGMWGAYAIYEDTPLPACNFLHNLEHGAVVLLYNCPDGCPEIVAALEQAIADAPNDPDCGAAKRLILTPYADMEATVAAAAWGYTWTADCLDGDAITSLQQFIAAHWGSSGDSPESTICSDGQIAP